MFWPKTSHEIEGNSRAKYPESRNSRGMSQEQLALAADMDRSYISEIELARFSVSVDILEQIALALEVAPKELFNERG